MPTLRTRVMTSSVLAVWEQQFSQMTTDDPDYVKCSEDIAALRQRVAREKLASTQSFFQDPDAADSD